MKTKKSIIKKSLEFTTEGIVIISGYNFICLYKGSLIEICHGSFSKEVMFVYNCTTCANIYEKQLNEIYQGIADARIALFQSALPQVEQK